MYVRMKKYSDWIGPYQIAKTILFWVKTDYESTDNTIVDKFSDWLSKNSKGEHTRLYQLCAWIHEKREANRVKIRIDKFDTWSMYHNLALIALPMLKELQKVKYGSPFVDDEDVPEHLRSTAAGPKNNDYDLDEFFHHRWDYVLEEMIWAFEQIIADDDTHYSFYHILPDGSMGEYMRDEEKEHEARIQNGTRLFGKYYQKLWW